MSDFDPPNNTFHPPQPQVPYTPCPEAARILAVGIQTGYISIPLPEGIPPEWVYAIMAVEDVAKTNRLTRWQAFTEAASAFDYRMVQDVNQATEASVDRTQKDRILYETKDCMHDPPVLDWVVEGIFARPSLNVLVGDPGAKKTYLAIDLAACVANGIPWLGHRIGTLSSQPALETNNPISVVDSAEGEIPEVPLENPPTPETEHHIMQSPLSNRVGEGSGVRLSSPIPVFLVDEETGYLQLWSRLHATFHAHDSAWGAPFNYTSLAGYDLRDSEDSDALIHRVLSRQAGLIIIDSFQSLLRGGENNPNSIQSVLFNLRRMAETCKAAAVVIHHNNREGAYRGSSAISASVDLMLSVSSQPTDSLIELRCLKARFQAPEPFCARAHFETTPDGKPRFHLTATGEKPADLDSQPEPAPAFSGVALDIMEFLSDHPSSTRAQINEALPDFAHGSIRNVLHRLIKSKQVKKTESTMNSKFPEYILSSDADQSIAGEQTDV